ncbi:MAG: biotin/lipoyl-binding protein [Candidatus Calescibacterium sp.]|nr:biotin/lipoyl-binding protein [Candidatus Calescibacterium sp.]MDW8133180.1 biotin/lipoyl-binding protein [Candidatus Calescibacterium sp.]
MRNIHLVYLILIFLFLGLSSCSRENTKLGSNSEAEKYLVPVLVKEAYFDKIDTFLEADARVEFRNISNLAFQVSGRIQDIFVQEGDTVEKGQILASLDKTVYNQQLQQAYQNVLASKENYEQAVYNLKIQKIQADSDLEKATLSYKQSQENLYLAQIFLYQSKNDFERYSKLHQEGVISSQQFENIKTQYQNNLTNYYNAKIALQQSKQNLNVAKLKKERISIFESQTKAAYSNYISSLKNYYIIKENFKYTDLYSPISGVVLKKYQDVGNVVSPSSVIFTIGLPQNKIVKASISDIDAKKVKPNSKAFVIFRNKQYEVIISKIYPNINYIGQSYVEARFIQPNNELNHNDYVNLKIVTKSISGVVVLRQAIVYSENSPYVFVVKDNKAIRKNIKIIDSSGDLAVVEGIEPKEKVIIDGQYFVKDGDNVKIVERK